MAIRETHDLGRTYVHGMTVPTGGPLVERGTSHEVEPPWRVGRCVVFRAWKWALVVGRWGPPRTTEEVEAAEAQWATEDGYTGAASVSPDDIRESFTPPPLGQYDTGWAGWVVR